MLQETRSHLDLPAGKAVYRLAGQLVGTVDAAARALEDPAREKAVGDFRRALLDLRDFLGLYGEWLPVAGWVRRALDDLVARAARQRDREVRFMLVRAEQATPALRHAAGVNLLLERLGGKLVRKRPRAVRRLRRGWRTLQPGLRRQLRRHRRRGGGSFRQVTLAAARAQLHRLDRRLARLETRDSDSAVQRAWATAGRLQLLLAPFHSSDERVRDTLEELGILRDALGDYRDAHHFLQRLGNDGRKLCGAHAAAVIGAIATREDDATAGCAHRPDPLPGLISLARTVKGQRARLWARFQSQYVAGRESLMIRIGDLLAALEGKSGMAAGEPAPDQAQVVSFTRYVRSGDD